METRETVDADKIFEDEKELIGAELHQEMSELIEETRDYLQSNAVIGMSDEELSSALQERLTVNRDMSEMSAQEIFDHIGTARMIKVDQAIEEKRLLAVMGAKKIEKEIKTHLDIGLFRSFAYKEFMH